MVCVWFQLTKKTVPPLVQKLRIYWGEAQHFLADGEDFIKVPGRRKRGEPLLSGPTLSFQIKGTLAFHLEITVPEIGLREEAHRNWSEASTISNR